MVKTFILIFVFLSTEMLSAQRTIEPKGFDHLQKGIIYNREWSLVPTLHTNGFALAFSKATLPKYNITHFRKIEIGYLKHPREHSQSTAPTQLSGGFKSYTYGKINYFFPIRVTMGIKRYLSEKSKRRGVALGYTYEGGVSLGILKPYQLKLIKTNLGSEESFISQEAYTEENAELFLDPSKIAGRAGIFKGFNDFTIRPGMTVKAGALFAWGAYDNRVLALETGVMLDLYYKEIALVANDQNQPYAINFYVSMHFGKRY